MNPLVLPLNIGKDDSFRMSWKSKLYRAKAAMVLPRRLTTDTDVHEVLESIQLVLRLSEFAGSLREKMLAALASPQKAHQNNVTVYGVVCQLNIQRNTVVAIEDVRQVITSSGSEHVNFMSDEATLLSLSEEEKDTLKRAITDALSPVVLEALRQPFVSFDPTLSVSWKEQNLSQIKADKLVPFQMLFPNTQPIERFVDGERFVIDDLYCTNPSCPCTDVTCVVLKLDQASGQEVAWGGFKWSSDSEKIRTLPQFASKFNASEWFKQFDLTSGVSLKLLLRSRQSFMRTQFIAARKDAR